jgi:cell filamentation protein
MRDKYGTEHDPYFYPGINVLINSLNIHNESTLQDAERDLSSLAAEN